MHGDFPPWPIIQCIETTNSKSTGVSVSAAALIIIFATTPFPVYMMKSNFCFNTSWRIKFVTFNIYCRFFNSSSNYSNNSLVEIPEMLTYN